MVGVVRCGAVRYVYIERKQLCLFKGHLSACLGLEMTRA